MHTEKITYLFWEYLWGRGHFELKVERGMNLDPINVYTYPENACNAHVYMQAHNLHVR